MRKIILAVLVMSLLVGMAAAVNTETTSSRNTSFNFEQTVTGDGYFMTYKYIQLDTPQVDQKGPMLKDYAHGSGIINTEVVIDAQDVDYSETSDGYITTEDYSCISMSETSEMDQAPVSVSYGNGYYAANPVLYDSLLKEKTCVKNYRPATSMHHEIEYAKNITKDLDVLVKDKNYTFSDPLHEGVGYTFMKVTEDVTDGRTHFGVLQGEPNNMASTNYDIPTTSVWKNPMIEVDEDYIGTYHIDKNMTIEVPYKLEIVNEDWLTCCIGGCEDIDPKDYGPYYNPCEGCMTGE
ncbi:MAG: hypothetical protein ACXQT4_06970 [Methanotrichaceae archaeon]